MGLSWFGLNELIQVYHTDNKMLKIKKDKVWSQLSVTNGQWFFLTIWDNKKIWDIIVMLKRQ